MAAAALQLEAMARGATATGAPVRVALATVAAVAPALDLRTGRAAVGSVSWPMVGGESCNVNVSLSGAEAR